YSAVAQKRGELSDTIRCRKSPDQTYALYLPKFYSDENRGDFGLILFFDPGARGKIPVSMYKDLADKYRVILACSNNSRNGPIEASLTAGNAVLDDVLSRFTVNRRFVIVSGFSGGGRTAIDMGARNSFGVITCGAAFPAPNPVTKDRPIPI